MFRADSMAKPFDEQELEADRSCFDCGRPIPVGRVTCTGCWIAADGAGYEVVEPCNTSQ